MSTSAIPGIGLAAPASTQTQPATTTNVADALSSTDTFLKLLVAQLENQDPLSPADSTQFVTQLATFSGVEQSTQMRDDLDAIRATLAAAAAASTSTASTAAAPSSASTTASAAIAAAAAAATAAAGAAAGSIDPSSLLPLGNTSGS